MRPHQLALVVLIGLATILAGPVAAGVPEIAAPVTTQFGTYVPVSVRASPRALQFTVQPGLANVDNAAHLALGAAQVQRLVEHGFFVDQGRTRLTVGGATAYQNMADVYLDAETAQVPAFITTDAMLHGFHRLFDHILKRTEEAYLIPTLDELSAQVLARLAAVHDTASEPAAVEAARLAGTYLAVGLRLLDPQAQVPAWTEPDLTSELSLIEAHTDITSCPLFHAYLEDYSQFIPRGHYTQSEALQRYFKAMIWYGRMTFALYDWSFLVPDQKGPQRPDLTAAALLLVRELDRIAADGNPAERWSTIWVPTVFFVGESDDLGPANYRELARSVYGAAPADLTPEQLCDPQHLQVFMDRAQTELPQPRIRSTAPQGMRLFGQRFVPDSWYFSELVYPAVEATPLGESRRLPSVLDILSVLGAVEAERLQREAGEERFPNYLEQVLALRTEVAGGGAERWASTLYWNWLYTLSALLGEWGDGFPPFMRDPLWTHRQFLTFAGSWTELRHDTILYAKQSYSGPTGFVSTAPFSQGYVEPNPWLFARLAALAAYARTGLDGLGVLDDDAASRLASLESGSLLLADVAARELERRPVSAEQFQFIDTFGRWLTNLLKLGDPQQPQETPDPHDRAPIVADIHTDPADPPRVLEEGTGYPGRIFVVADVEGRLQVCVGAVFVPYEFAWPASDRLTDEAWWSILETQPPDLPWWGRDLFDTPAASAGTPGLVPTLPRPGELSATLQRDTVPVGENLVLECSSVPSAVELRPALGAPVRVNVDPGANGPITLATRGLPAGDLTVVACLSDGTTYAVRAHLAEPHRAPRRHLHAGHEPERVSTAP